MKNAEERRGPYLVRVAIAAAMGLGLYASTLPVVAAEEAGTEQLDEVAITGSRIIRKDYVSPNPVTTITTEDLERLAINNIGDAIIQVPQNVSQFTPANTGGSAFFVGSTLANLRGLNPFFGTRTLTLVDTRRFIPTTQGDAVDLNFIPSNLVQRMETVTGGASAAYGSGAVSGVVNIILDKRLKGLKVDADFSQTQEGDGDNYRLGVAGGTDFFGTRGHVVLGGEYQKMKVIQSCADARDWCGDGNGLYNNSTFFFGGAGQNFTPNIPGQPHFMVVSGLRANQISRSGVIFNNGVNATTASQFNAAGTDIIPFAIGQQGFRNVGGLVVGGDGDPAYTNLTLQPDVERKTGFSHVEFKFNDAVTGYGELSYGQVTAANNQFETTQNTANTCIRPDNAYLAGLPSNARNTVLGLDGNGAFNADNLICSSFFLNVLPFITGVPASANTVAGTVVSKNWQGQNLQIVNTDTKVTRAVLGANGTLGSNWNWDAYYQYGKTVRDQIGHGYRTNWRYTFATDAVIDNRDGSPTEGQAVCRVTRDGMPAYTQGLVDPSVAVGCQPLNVFGTNSASPQALAYAFSSLNEHNIIRQDVMAASVNGELWEGYGAGPLSAAFGVEYRKDKLSNDAGSLPTPLRTDFSLQYGDSFAGSTKVMEGFGEFEMGLLRDIFLAKQVTLNASIRQAQYKTAGATAGAVGGSNKTNINTWKLATVWDMSDWLRFRASYSSDIRAPNFRELFYSQTIPAGGFFGSVNNPWIIPPPQGSISDPTVWQLMGNTDLDPEKAKTGTIGMVIQPVGTGLQFSVDYYQIKLKGGLALALGGPAAVTACYTTGDPFFCSLLTFGTPRPDQTGNPNAQFTNITNMKTLYTNQNPYTAKGLDFGANYHLDANRVVNSMPGSFAMNLALTHMMRQTAPVFRAGFVPGQAELAGQTGGDAGFLSDVAPAPSWSGTLAVSYLNGPFTGSVQTRFVGSGHMDLQNPKTGPDDPAYDPTKSYSVSDNTNRAYFVFSLNSSYDLKWFDLQKFQVFGSINNLFNRDPPFSSGGVGGANAVNYDILGRTFRVGFRMKL